MESIAILRRLVAQDPTSTADRLLLAEKLVRVAQAVEDDDEARRNYAEAVQIFAAYGNANPTDIDKQYRVASVHNAYARLLEDTERLREARRVYEASLVFGARIMAATSEGDPWWRSVYHEARSALDDMARQ